MSLGWPRLLLIVLSPALPKDENACFPELRISTDSFSPIVRLNGKIELTSASQNEDDCFFYLFVTNANLVDNFD